MKLGKKILIMLAWVAGSTISGQVILSISGQIIITGHSHGNSNYLLRHDIEEQIAVFDGEIDIMGENKF